MCDQCEDEGINDDPKGRAKVNSFKEEFHDAPPEPSLVQKIVRILVIPWTPFLNPIIDRVALWGFKRTMANMLSDALEGKAPKRMSFQVTTRDGRRETLDMMGGAIAPRSWQGKSNRHPSQVNPNLPEEEEEDNPAPKRPNRRPKNREDQLEMLNKMWGE